MKVKDLIKVLELVDPELDVVAYSQEYNTYEIIKEVSLRHMNEVDDYAHKNITIKYYTEHDDVFKDYALKVDPKYVCELFYE